MESIPLKTIRLPSGEMTALFKRTFSGRRTFVRSTRSEDGAAGRGREKPSHAAARTATAAIAQDRRSLLRRRDETVAGAATPAADPCAIQRSSLATSPADCQRSSGSFSRQVRTTRSSAGGVMGETCEISGGSSRKIEEIRDACVVPE